MKLKYYHKKLIRDKIPEIIKKSGDDCEIMILGKAAFEKELKKKLLEESIELTKAPKEKLLNELADVLELTKSIATYHKIPYSRVEKSQEMKRKQSGGFKKKLFLKWSTRKEGR
jgi:predicted house-cleaning noncanonical NTP pyrophosphatase (MazG superfamily)